LIVSVLNQAPADSDRAAQLCDALVFGGYSDWFLPSKHEADMMCWNLRGKRDSTSDFWDGSTTDNPDVPAGGVGGFADEGYWTSSEINLFNAWGLGIGIGNQFLAPKTNEYRVRAVRAF